MWHRTDLMQTDIPPKRRFTLDVNGATSQKTELLKSEIVTLKLNYDLFILLLVYLH